MVVTSVGVGFDGRGRDLKEVGGWRGEIFWGGGWVIREGY